MNTLYDLRSPKEIVRWLLGLSRCVAVGHSWTDFPIYRDGRPESDCFICTRCQKLELRSLRGD